MQMGNKYSSINARLLCRIGRAEEEATATSQCSDDCDFALVHFSSGEALRQAAELTEAVAHQFDIWLSENTSC